MCWIRSRARVATPRHPPDKSPSRRPDPPLPQSGQGKDQRKKREEPGCRERWRCPAREPLDLDEIWRRLVAATYVFRSSRSGPLNFGCGPISTFLLFLMVSMREAELSLTLYLISTSFFQARSSISLPLAVFRSKLLTFFITSICHIHITFQSYRTNFNQNVQL